MKWSLCIALMLVGCNSWEADSEYRYPVFSDDGVGMAAAYMTFESKYTFTHNRTRNHYTQVVMKENTDTSVPTPLTSLMEGSVRDLFYMRDEGYIILGRQGGEATQSDGSSERKIWYDFIELDGTVTSIESGIYRSMLSCDGGSSAASTAGPLRVIPSPDGSVLAKFEAESDCDERVMSVTFLDPADLSVLNGPISVPDVAPPSGFGATMWATADLGWTDSDVFSAGFWGTGSKMDHMEASQVDVDGTVDEEVEVHMSCFYPPTTSSDTNEDGEGIEIDGNTGSVQILTTSYGTSYGCDE